MARRGDAISEFVVADLGTVGREIRWRRGVGAAARRRQAQTDRGRAGLLCEGPGRGLAVASCRAMVPSRITIGIGRLSISGVTAGGCARIATPSSALHAALEAAACPLTRSAALTPGDASPA